MTHSLKTRFNADDDFNKATPRTQVREIKHFLNKENIHIHKHDNEFHLHEHNHGDSGTIVVTTTGLVLHSAADGIALGASLFISTKSIANGSLGVIVFMAVLLHKVPAAIGFGSFLLHEGKNSKEMLKYLLWFTTTSPLLAALTFFALELSGIKTLSDSLMFWVGVLLLFSAGAFLYVATIHILPEVFCSTDVHRPHTHKHLPEDHIHDDEHFSKGVELVAMIFGMTIPFVVFVCLN